MLLTASTRAPFSGSASGRAVISSAYTQGWPRVMLCSAFRLTV